VSARRRYSRSAVARGRQAAGRRGMGRRRGKKRERSTVGENGKVKRCLAKIFGLGLAELNGEKVLKRNLASDLFGKFSGCHRYGAKAMYLNLPK